MAWKKTCLPTHLYPLKERRKEERKGSFPELRGRGEKALKSVACKCKNQASYSSP